MNDKPLTGVRYTAGFIVVALWYCFVVCLFKALDVGAWVSDRIKRWETRRRGGVS